MVHRPKYIKYKTIKTVGHNTGENLGDVRVSGTF